MSTTETINIAEAKVELQRGLRLFKVFEHADKVLDALLQADQLQKELDKAISGKRSELERTTAEVTASIATLREQEDAARATTAAAEESAKDAGRKTIATAEARAARIVEQATATQQQADDNLAAAQAKVAEVNGQITAKTAELADIESKLAKARAQVEKLLG